jgi:hypothetical protein
MFLARAGARSPDNPDICAVAIRKFIATLSCV